MYTHQQYNNSRKSRHSHEKVGNIIRFGMVLVGLSYPLKKNQGREGGIQKTKNLEDFFFIQQPTLPVKKGKENSLDNQSSNFQARC